MAASAAYVGTVKIGGTPTTITDEATSAVTPGFVYQITDSTKQILDPDTAVTVEVDATPADPADYTVDYLFGRVTFDDDQGAGVVTVSGKYIPVVTVAECSKWEISASRTVLDKTSLDSGGYRSRMAGVSDLTGSLSSFAGLDYDHDTGGGTKKFSELYANGTPMLLEIRPAGSGEYFRAWVKLDTTSAVGGFDELNDFSINYQAASPAAGDAFGWGT